MDSKLAESLAVAGLIDVIYALCRIAISFCCDKSMKESDDKGLLAEWFRNGMIA